MPTAVHQLWPPPGDMRRTEMNILFCHGYSRDPEEWKSTWTQRNHPDVCWPEKWLAADLSFDVRVLFVSYYGQSRVADIVDDLFKTLVTRDEWDLCKDHQPLVLVGRGFGTLVLDDLFLKATEEVLTSSTEAGAFVRNVRGVTFYRDGGEAVKSYKIEKHFESMSRHIKGDEGTSDDEETSSGDEGTSRPGRPVYITQGTSLIDPTIYEIVFRGARDVMGMVKWQWIKEVSWDNWYREVQWKADSKQSQGYRLLLESCRAVVVSQILEDLQKTLDNFHTAYNFSDYFDSKFMNEFTYLRCYGVEGAKILIVKILIVQWMLATMGMDYEDDILLLFGGDEELSEIIGIQLAILLKFTIKRFCENGEWQTVPTMSESDLQRTVASSLNDVGISDVLRKTEHFPDGFVEIVQSIEENLLGGTKDFPPAFFPTANFHSHLFLGVWQQSILSIEELQQLACNMQGGENLLAKDVQEQLTPHMLHRGELIVTARILEDQIQFLFGNAKSMAQIVGVGLDFATVFLTRQNAIVVEGITELEWTRLWGEVFLGESLFGNPILMEKVVPSPPEHEKPQGSHVNALLKVAMFFVIEKFLQNLDVGKVYNQVVRGVATTMTEENQSDIGLVHAKSVNDPSTEILGLNLWDYLSRLQITRGLGSATRDTSGEGGSHLGGTDTPSEGDKDQGGDGGEDDDNRKGRGAKGKEIQQNNQRDVLVTVHTGYEHGVWNRNPVPEQLEGSDIDPIPEQLKKSYTTPFLTFLFKKTEKQQSNTIESKIKVSCGMDTSSLDQVNDCSKRFGWCQNHLHVSLQCLGCDAATLYGSSLVGTQDLKDTFMEQTQATSSQATFGVTGGFHGFASASASFMKPLASTLQSNQRVTERPSEYISGTGFQPECHDLGGPTPILRYDFNFRPELPTNMFPDGSDQEKYHGMRCTVYPRFEGVWGLLSQDEACKYEFRVERHVCELVCVAQSLWFPNPKTWGRGKQKLLCNCNKMLQTYKVTLYINHKMSNIGTLQEFGTDTLSKGNPKNALMELSVDPSGRGSDEASSSTQ